MKNKTQSIIEDFEEELKTFGSLCWNGGRAEKECQYDRVVETFKEALELQKKEHNKDLRYEKEVMTKAILQSKAGWIEEGAIDERKKIEEIVEQIDATTVDKEKVKSILQYILKEINKL